MKSQNGWTVYDTAPPATTPWITGRVRPGDVDVIFTWLGEQFHERVEHIRKDWSWGWAKRPVRGSTTVISNHASATANDFNAPAHVLGKRGTFSPRQVNEIHEILRELEGVIRWGGDFKNRADEMHFEVIGNAAEVRAVADKIRRGTIGRVSPWKWNPEVRSELAKIQRQFQIAAGVVDGALQRYHGNAAIQHALNVKFLGPKGLPLLTVDGWVGPETVAAWKAYEKERGGTGRLTTPDPVSLGPEGLQILYRFTGPEAS